MLSRPFSDQIAVLERHIALQRSQLGSAQGDDRSLIGAEISCLEDTVRVIKAIDDLASPRVWRRGMAHSE